MVAGEGGAGGASGPFSCSMFWRCLSQRMSDKELETHALVFKILFEKVGSCKADYDYDPNSPTAAKGTAPSGTGMSS